MQNIEDEIPDITKLATTAALNAKINQVKNEMLGISNLATATALNAKINEVKNKVLNITKLAINYYIKLLLFLKIKCLMLVIQ